MYNVAFFVPRFTDTFDYEEKEFSNVSSVQEILYLIENYKVDFVVVNIVEKSTGLCSSHCIDDGYVILPKGEKVLLPIVKHDYFKDIEEGVKRSRDIASLIQIKKVSRIAYEENKSFPPDYYYWSNLNIHCAAVRRLDKVLKTALNALAVCAVVNCLTNTRYDMSKVFHYLLEENHFYHFTQFTTIVIDTDGISNPKSTS